MNDDPSPNARRRRNSDPHYHNLDDLTERVKGARAFYDHSDDDPKYGHPATARAMLSDFFEDDALVDGLFSLIEEEL